MLTSVKTLLNITCNDFDKELELWIAMAIDYLNNAGVHESQKNSPLYNSVVALFVKNYFDGVEEGRILKDISLFISQLRCEYEE